MYIDANPGGIGNLKIWNTTFRNNFAGGGGAVAIDAVLGGTIEAEFKIAFLKVIQLLPEMCPAPEPGFLCRVIVGQ